jgi:putative copper resistance protein D
LASALAVCRFLHFLAALLVFGASVYLRLHAPYDLRQALTPVIRRLTISASIIALVTAFLWPALISASMTDNPASATDSSAIASILADTGFGHAWLLHCVLAAALVAATFASRRGTAVVVLSGLMLASLGLVGHAAMQTGVVGALHRANAALHLLAAGTWLGGLIPFVLCLDLASRPGLRRDAVKAMMRFSFFGHFVVAAIVATGVANIALTSGRVPLPPLTPYRALLDVKIGVVALMIALAVVNRYVLVPRLRRHPYEALRAMRRLSLVNVGFGAVVVALVSAFALMDPA